MQPVQPLPYSASAVRKGVFFTTQFVIVSPPGGGKTTLSDAIARHFTPLLAQKSAGGFMRERARQYGFGERIHDFAKHMHDNPHEGHDAWCDQQVAALGRTNNIVIDCHLPPFAPYGFTILLVCDLGVRAERRAPKHPDQTLGQVANDLRQRGENDDAKYAKMYPGSLWSHHEYDLVLDTQVNNPAQCLALTLEAHKCWLQRHRHGLISDGVINPDLLDIRVSER